MKAVVEQRDGSYKEMELPTPTECFFCDTCGDCLRCGDDYCEDGGRWVVYFGEKYHPDLEAI